jgi:hypothetical protein
VENTCGATSASHGEAKPSNHMSPAMVIVPTTAALNAKVPKPPACRAWRACRAINASISPQNPKK